MHVVSNKDSIFDQIQINEEAKQEFPESEPAIGSESSGSIDDEESSQMSERHVAVPENDHIEAIQIAQRVRRQQIQDLNIRDKKILAHSLAVGNPAVQESLLRSIQQPDLHLNDHQIKNLKVADALFESRMKAWDDQKSDTSNDFRSDSMEELDGPSQIVVRPSSQQVRASRDDLLNFGLRFEEQKASDQRLSAQISLSKRSLCACNMTVMIVDDTEFNIIPVEQMLIKHFNVKVTKAPNGKVAVDMFTEGLQK